MLYLTLRHYSYVVAIAEQGSLSGAAAVLNVSQPSLSNALDIIEDRLKMRLFLRGRGVVLSITPDGRHFVAKVTDLLKDAQRLEQAGQEPLLQDRVTLGCFHDLAPFVLAPALSALRHAMPEVELHSALGSFETLAQDMIAGHIDLAITWDIGLDARFDKRPLGHLRPHAFLPERHRLAGRGDIALADLAGDRLILSDEGLSVQHMIRLCETAGFTPRIAEHAASVEVMRSLAAHGEGIGISYSVPPAGHSYDGRPLHSVAIRDEHAVEKIVLVQLGHPVRRGTLDQLGQALIAAALIRPIDLG
ncbi:MAG: DNA-binding transcriptional LysR family regulator [Sulfitobacter sp.]|jgi:DNA-binding transcriptional LysR family regulator